MSETFTDPPPELGLRGRIPGNIDDDRTWIDRAVPYTDNVNVYSTLTFSNNNTAGRGGRAAHRRRADVDAAITTRPTRWW